MSTAIANLDERAAVETEDLTVSTRHGTTIAAGVSIAVRPGQLLGLVGETGAGKTVTARAMLGLLPRGLRASGRVRFSDTDWLRLDQPDRIARELGRSTGLMLQNPAAAFDPLQRIGPQLIEAVVRNKLMSKESAIERATALCDYLGLGDASAVFGLYPHQLSGGMSQRASLALTLMPKPRVVIVDEPTSALDANLRVHALKLLRSIAQESRTAMLLISHDLGLVSHFCDRICVLYAGHVAETGPTNAVLRHPDHPYTRALISCSLSLSRPKHAILRTVGGEPPMPGDWPVGCFFHPRCPDAQDRCRADRPVFTTSADRGVACHFAGQREQA